MDLKRQLLSRPSRGVVRLSYHPVLRTLIPVPRWKEATTSMQKQSSTGQCVLGIAAC